MAATLYKGHEAFLYLEDTDAQNPNIPDTGITDASTNDTTNLVGRLEDFTCKIDNGLEAYYGTGSRDPTDIKEGNRAITGTAKRAIINGAWLTAALGSGSGTTPNTITAGAVGAYKMKFRLYTSATQYYYVILTSVKFGSYALEGFTNDGGTVKENVEWMGIFSSAKSYGTPTAGV